MNPPASDSPPRSLVSLGLPLLRVLALLGLALGFSIACGVFLLPLFRAPERVLVQVISNQLPSLDLDFPLVFLLLPLTPLAIGFAARRLPLRTSRGKVILGLVAVTSLVLNLVLCALSPAVNEGFTELFGLGFWDTYGAGLALLVVTLALIWIAARRLVLHSVRGAVWFAVAIAALLTFDLVLAAVFPSLLYSRPGVPFFFAFNAEQRAALHDLGFIAMLFAAPPFIGGFVVWKWRLHSWRWIGGAALVLAPALLYLGTDDATILRPLTMEEIAPAFPGAEQSFEVLMRYGKNHPLGQKFRAPDRMHFKIAPGESNDPAKPAEYRAFLLSHRQEIEADWADLAPLRAWWAELNAFDRIGDLTPPQLDAETISFTPVRTMVQHACAVAGLMALDGHADEAVDTLLPVLQVGRKLQPSARHLVRQMLAIVTERLALRTASFILDQTTVSPAARDRLMAALTAPGGGPAGARRLVMVEYAFAQKAYAGLSLGDQTDVSPGARYVLNVLSPFLFHPRATNNLQGEYLAELQELLGSRQLKRIEPWSADFFETRGRPRAKNFAGAVSLRESLTVYRKLGETYWQIQDLRAEVIARLQRPLSAPL
jgi:hypothetical protein